MRRCYSLLWFLFLLFPALAQDRISGSLEHYFNGGNREASNPYNNTSLDLGYERVLSPVLTFTAAASAEADWTFPEDVSFVTGDISRFSLRYAPSWTAEAGRVHFSDATGYILDLNLDGVKGSYPLGDTLSVRGGMGYTGLTFDHASGLIKTREESAGDELLSPDRLVWFLRGSYRDEKGREGNAHFYGQSNLNGSDDPLLLWYAGAFGSLTVSDFVFTLDYTFAGGTVGASYLGSIYENSVAGHLVYGEAGYYPSGLREWGVRAVLTGFYSSGDSYNRRETNLPGADTTVEPDGTSALFIPISRTLIGSQLGEQPGNLAFLRLEAGFVPLKGRFDKNILAAALGSAVYMRTANGPIHASGLNPLSDSPYLGTEINGKLTYRPFSDLSLSLDNQFFLPNTSSGGAFDGTRDSLEYALELVLTLSI